MLGTELVETLQQQHIPVVALTRAEADITDAVSVRSRIQAGDIVVNCAAWTRVDDAESHRDAAFAINAEGPRVLAQTCAGADARLIHFSTDYVFGDVPAGTPIAVNAPTHPNSVYGESKALGETFVREVLGEDALIVRIAWLYGGHGRNFVSTICGKLDQGAALRVVDDQIGQSTWTRDVARATLALVKLGSTGTHHLTNAGQCSWFEFACAIAELTGHDPALITPVPSSEYPTPAKRPAWSVLASDPHVQMQPWRLALAEFLTAT